MTTRKFIGRTSELAVLRESVDRALDGRYGNVATIKGAPGVGKTRLVEEIAVYATEKSVRTVWSHNSDDEGAPPLWPWVQVLRKLVGQMEIEHLNRTQPVHIKRIASHIREFAFWSVDSIGTPSVDSSTERFLLFDAVRTIISEVAKRQPLLLLLEDFQRADESSQSVLDMLMEPPGPQYISIVLTVREDLLVDQSSGRSPLAIGSYGSTSINLDDFDRNEFSEMFADLVEPHVDNQTLGKVWTITGGNPLFIREFASSWKPGTDLRELAAPASTAESIKLRLSTVPTNKLKVIEYGSALGGVFDFSRLTAVMGDADHNFLAETLQWWVDFGIIEEKSDSAGWFKFTHEIIRQAIYTQLTNSERAMIHRRIAEGLEKLFDESSLEHAAEISGHWQRAGITGDLNRSAYWALLAGKQALDTFSYDVAHRFFEHALQAGQQINSNEVEAEGLAGTGEAMGPLGREKEAITFLKLAFDRFIEYGQIDRAIRVAQISFTGSEGQLGMAPIYERALEFVDPESIEAARIQAPLARVVAIELGDYKRGQALIGSVIETSRRTVDRRTELVALGYAVQIAAFAGKWNECATYCQQVLALQGSVEDPYPVSTAAMLLAYLRFQDGRLQESDALITRARSAAEYSGSKVRISSCDLIEQRLAHHRCQWERADLAASKSEPDVPGYPRILALTALCKHLVGDAKAGNSALQQYLELPDSERLGAEAPDAQFFPLLARSTLDPAHIAITAEAARTAVKNSSGFVRLRGVVAKGWVAVEENDQATAKDVREVLKDVELMSDEKSLIPALDFLCGNIEDAAAGFEVIIELLRSTGHTLYEAWTRFDFSRLLTDHPEIRPSLTASKYATETRSFALSLGLLPLTARLDDLLAKQGVVRTPFDLTRREMDVLSLVAQGMTNKEIADQLVVSPHTVNRHLANLFSKLGVSSRAAATDLAHQKSLV